MKELLSATIPADVGQALLVGLVLLAVGLLGVIAGTATERSRTRRDLQEVFTDPDTAKTIFVAQWSVSTPAGGETIDADALWSNSDDLRTESAAAAQAIHDRVTTELGL